MTTHGKYCDFDFYVTSLDAENGCAATEPMSSGLSLLEAVSEFYKRITSLSRFQAVRDSTERHGSCRIR